jgi:hypothetical protein
MALTSWVSAQNGLSLTDPTKRQWTIFATMFVLGLPSTMRQ